jgi:hypothetical protein
MRCLEFRALSLTLPAMHPSLGFSRITAEAAQLQVHRIAAEAELAASEAAAAAETRRADEELASEGGSRRQSCNAVNS